MLKNSIDWLFYSLLGFGHESKLAEILNFFLYDSIKIIALLFIMILVMGFIRSYLSQDAIKKWLSKRKGWANLYASLFGAVTPFCSCSSIPIFLSFMKVGIPLGASLSFLITSPLVNEYLVVLMLGYFGWEITVLYILSGILIGVISGVILGKIDARKYLVEDLFNEKDIDQEEAKCVTVKDRIDYGLKEANSIVKKLWIWVLVGVGIGAIIHNYVPKELIHSVINKTGIFSVPLAVILGVPMYGSCAAIVPIAVVLFRKGIPLGTALAFMMATAALSLPEAILLRRAMKLQLIAIFFLITSVAIVLTGYLFNYLQTILMG